jgi:uncharacterized membrane protein
MRSLWQVAGAAAEMGVGAGLVCAQTPGITGVGQQVVAALSADGLVAVGSVVIAGGQAYRWVRTGPFSGASTLLPRGGSFGTAVTADGAVVFGYSTFHAAGMQSYTTFRWRPPYTSADPLTSSGCGNGGVVSVSDDGAVAVGTYTNCTFGMCSNEVTYWLVPPVGPGTPHCLHMPSDWYYANAYSTSSDGSIVVGMVATRPADPILNAAYVWHGTPGTDGTAELFPGLGGVGSAFVRAVSRDGLFAGGSCGHLARWPLSAGSPGPAEDLGVPDGLLYGTINALNSDGSVGVGTGSLSSGPYRAVLWNVRVGAVDLNTYLPATGIDLTGWRLDEATAVSSDGFTVAGNGTHNGVQEGFVVVLSRCGWADFNHDGDSATDADIEAFFACLAGNCCARCDSADFDGDGSAGNDADIEAFFRVLAGGAC